MFRISNHNCIVITRTKQLESFNDVSLFLGTHVCDDANAFTQSLFTSANSTTNEMKKWKCNHILLKSIGFILILN